MATSGTPSEYANSELPVSITASAPSAVADRDGGKGGPGYPPYAPYKHAPAPPSVADTIVAGRKMRIRHKSLPQKPPRAPPKPANPKGPKLTDVRMPPRQWRAHQRCLRKHGAVLTDRLERIARPTRRQIINMWRENADRLAPETIYRFRNMLAADEPFKPDQAYDYFVNLRKCKKKACDKLDLGGPKGKKDLLAICGDRKFVWARNATVAFARGIQQRLSRPGGFTLADGMLRLSNIILDEICSYMKMKKPMRRSRNPKSKYLVETADKIAVWIDEILSESDERMLMMDFDEDEEVEQVIGAKRLSIVKMPAAPGDTSGSEPGTPGTRTPEPGSPPKAPGSPPGPAPAPGSPPAAVPPGSPPAAVPAEATTPTSAPTPPTSSAGPSEASAPSSAPTSGASTPVPPPPKAN